MLLALGPVLAVLALSMALRPAAFAALALGLFRALGGLRACLAAVLRPAVLVALALGTMPEGTRV